MLCTLYFRTHTRVALRWVVLKQGHLLVLILHTVISDEVTMLRVIMLRLCMKYIALICQLSLIYDDILVSLKLVNCWYHVKRYRTAYTSSKHSEPSYPCSLISLPFLHIKYRNSCQSKTEKGKVISRHRCTDSFEYLWYALGSRAF